MNAGFNTTVEKKAETIKFCSYCGIREGGRDPEGKPVKLEQHEGRWRCPECQEVLLHVQRWV